MTSLTIEDYEAMVRRPGKFEGEARYVPYFWFLSLEGGETMLANGVVCVRVDREDRKLFPELKRRKMIRMVETDNGFVCEV